MFIVAYDLKLYMLRSRYKKCLQFGINEIISSNEIVLEQWQKVKSEK